MSFKKFGVFIWVLLLASTIWFLSQRWELAGNELPAPGLFFSPFHGFWQQAEDIRVPRNNINLTHPMLEYEVSIVLNERMVPHIFAQSETDAAFAQGYMQAKHRLWQMDISTRDISGRLAEVIGERALDRDILTCKQGFRWAIDKALQTYSKDQTTMAILQAYTEGVNHYIHQLKPRDYPLEFKLLGYAPEEWTIRHSVAASKSMARVLTMGAYDVANHHLLASLGEDLFHFLFPDFMDPLDPVHPGSWEHLPAAVSHEATLYKGNLGSIGLSPVYLEEDPSNMASNNWAIGPEKSESGNPILCSDPHLSLSLPSVWYETHLHTPELNAYGVSLLGLPSIVIGFNEHIAWGLTNGGIDVLDYLSVTWENEKKERYLLDGEWRNIDHRTEQILVKGRDLHEEQVAYTTWGPIAKSADENIDTDLCMKWTAHDSRHSSELGVFHALCKAKNLSDYEAAISVFPSPIQNIVFASREGDIAIKSAGYWPLRSNRAGKFIADGSVGTSAWQTYIPENHIPITINPLRGFVSSANQESTFQDYPYPYWGSFENYRGRILNRFLSEKEKFNRTDMKNIQFSNYSLYAEEAVPSLLTLVKYTNPDERTQQVMNKLKTWDYQHDADAQAPALFDLWMKKITELTFDETISGATHYMNRVPDKWVLVKLLQEEPGHIVFDRLDTPGREQATDIVTAALQTIINELEEQFGDLDNFTWHDVQKPHIAHLASIGPFGAHPKTGGAAKALNAMSSQHGPSWRQVIELTPDGPIAFGIYPGGQSGNPGSPFYDDSIEKWAAGDYHALKLYTKPEDVENAILTITLQKPH